MQTRSMKRGLGETKSKDSQLTDESSNARSAPLKQKRIYRRQSVDKGQPVFVKVEKEKDIDEDNAEILKIELENERNHKQKKVNGKRNTGKAPINKSPTTEVAEISNMTIDDLKSVYRLGEKIFTTDYPELHRTWDEFEVVNNFNSETEYCLIARINGKIVGFALGTIIEKSCSGWKYGYLAWIGVNRKYQRKGVGTKLFMHFRQLMFEKDVRMMLADTNSANNPAVSFLEKMGFGHKRDHVYLSLNLDKDRKMRDGVEGIVATHISSNKKKIAPRLIPPTLPMPAEHRITTKNSTSKNSSKNGKKKRSDEEKGHVIVREMEINDLADVFHLGERIFTSKFVNLYRIWSEWEVTDLYNSDPEYCYVAEVDGNIAGFSMGYIIKKSNSAWTYGYLVWLGVSPDYQRMGIAWKLFNHFKKMMEDESIRMLIVDTQADNEPAVNFFKKAGFGHPQQHMYLSLNMNPVAENVNT